MSPLFLKQFADAILGLQMMILKLIWIIAKFTFKAVRWVLIGLSKILISLFVALRGSSKSMKVQNRCLR